MRKCRHLAWVVCGLALFAQAALAAEYPSRPVAIVNGFSTGGGTDLITRLVASKLAEKWHQAVLVENRVGAEGTIALNFVAHAAPDGYTLICVPNTFILPRSFQIAYDPLKSFAPVSNLVRYPSIFLANPALPVNSLKELIALAKSEPGKLNYGSLGEGEVSGLMMQMFLQRTGTRMVGVRYQGGGAAINALMGNEVSLYFAPPASSLQAVKEGRLKGLAVTSATSSPLMPEIPTVAEAADLPGYDAGNWNAILAPAGTPKEVIAKLHDDIVEVVKLPDVQKTMAGWAITPDTDTPEELAALIGREAAMWGALAKQGK